MRNSHAAAKKVRRKLQDMYVARETSISMETINWGIIGCGEVCEVKSGPAFQQVPGSKLAAVMRRDEIKAADFARRHQVLKYYTDAAQLIADPEINAIYIATPPHRHEAYTLAALSAGKPVYVEKPVALNAASARRMAEASDNLGIPLCVAHYRRQQPQFLKIKEMLQQGAIGAVRAVNLCFKAPARAFNLAEERISWRLNPQVSGGGIFHDLAPHQLDLLHYFFGHPLLVKGMAANRAGLYEAPDVLSASLLFSGNIVATASWLFTAADGVKEDYCCIEGSEGNLQFSVFGATGIEWTRGQQKESINFPVMPHVQAPMIAAVTQHFLGAGPNPCGPWEGVRVMETMDAISGK